MRPLAWSVLLGVLLLGSAAWLAMGRKETPLPADLAGQLVFVSDRPGVDTLYARRLPDGEGRRLTHLAEPIAAPALSPDGTRVAFATGGRIGVLTLATGAVRILTLGVDWRDEMPAWRPDAEALVVCARRPGEENRDLHLLAPLDPKGTETLRQPLTLTRGLDETEPAFGPDGSFVVFVREDNLFRTGLAEERPRRLTGGLRKTRHPRFLPDGRLLCLWRQDKLYGIDVLDAALKSRETLWQGSTCYSSVVPSPDGRYLAATYSFDLSFHPLDALRPRHVEELRLLDAHGAPMGVLVRSWRYTHHSPQWGSAR